MNRYQTIVFILAVFCLFACRSEETTSVSQREVPQETRTPAQSIRAAAEKLDAVAREGNATVTSQTVYVPIYSHIYFQDKSRTLNLTATLSIRNTDLTHPITVTAVRYYDTDGNLIRKYVEQPIRLAALATTEFLVEEQDTRGGSGANFIVGWSATERVTEPVVEAVMVNSSLGLGFAFISPGRVITHDNAPSTQ